MGISYTYSCFSNVTGRCHFLCIVWITCIFTHIKRKNVFLNFSSGSICLVLASHLFDEEDYIREYADYLSMHVENRKEE